MSRRQFETVVASAVRQKLKSQQTTLRDNILVNGIETVDIYAPTGVIGSLESLYMTTERPVEATSGEHVFFLKNNIGASYCAIRQPYNVKLGFNAFEFLNTGTAVVVSPTNNVVHALKGVKFTDNFPARFEYQNYTSHQTQYNRILTQASWTQGGLNLTTGAIENDGLATVVRTNFMPTTPETLTEFTLNFTGGSLGQVRIFEYDSLNNFLRQKIVAENILDGALVSHTLGADAKQVRIRLYDLENVAPLDVADSTFDNKPHRTYNFVYLEVDSPN